jgi:competence protein ComFC
MLDFLLPQRCLLCNQEISRGMICHNCLDYIPVSKPPFCVRCGRPVKKNSTCNYCKEKKYFDHGRAFMLFVPPADKIIHHFKYEKKTALAKLLGRAMANLIRTDHDMKKADLIVPVPLFWWKDLRRGYNQAALLCDVISSECKIMKAKILKRVRNTKSQTKLSEDDRRQNMFNAFRVDNNGIEGKCVILVDDVMTTGVTVNECAKVLKAAGAAKVYSCVAAITPG